jgi:hypothetical protein
MRYLYIVELALFMKKLNLMGKNYTYPKLKKITNHYLNYNLIDLSIHKEEQ